MFSMNKAKGALAFSERCSQRQVEPDKPGALQELQLVCANDAWLGRGSDDA